LRGRYEVFSCFRLPLYSAAMMPLENEGVQFDSRQTPDPRDIIEHQLSDLNRAGQFCARS